MSINEVTAHNFTEDCGNVVFSPPLYKQRYDLAAGILREARVTSVCSALWFLQNKEVGFMLKYDFLLPG